MKGLEKIINRFSKHRVLVIGDLMLDKFIEGNVSRISPEAPVPVALVVKENYFPGGASNTAGNISSLGGGVYVVGLIGKDEPGRILVRELKRKGMNTGGVFKGKKVTTQKERITAQHQQLFRVDREKVEFPNKIYEAKVKSYVSSVKGSFDVIVVSDYEKGFVTRSLVDFLVKTGKPVVLDPKPGHVDMYQGVYLMTPNIGEATAMTGIKYDGDASLKKIGKKLMEHSDNVLLTLGGKGMMLFEKNGKITHHYTKAKDVFDVTGAGDTVISTIALSLAAKASLSDAVDLSNYAAGITVGKYGTHNVSSKELKDSLRGEK